MSDAAHREQNEKVRERFTRSGEAFARLATPHRVGDAETIVRLANPPADGVALDLACGPGTFTLALAQRTRRVVGVDLTPAFLEIARRRMRDERADNVTLLCADATAVPLRDESTDTVVCGYSLHHMDEPLRAIKELARVLRRGGRAALVDLIVARDSDAETTDEIERTRDVSHLHTFLHAEFTQCVEEAGLCVSAVQSLDRTRKFSEWMRIAGWAPGDPAWRNTRRLMEACLSGETPGFSAHVVPGTGEGEPEIEFVQSCLFVAASKP